MHDFVDEVTGPLTSYTVAEPRYDPSGLQGSSS